MSAYGVPVEKVCRGCANFEGHWTGVMEVKDIGTCRLGGPVPGLGSSDVCEDETCEKWAAKKEEAS